MFPTSTDSNEQVNPNSNIEKIPQKEEMPTVPDVVRSEVNLLVLPFFALWDKDVKKKTKTEYKTSVRRGGQRLEVSWQVTSNSEYGYPGPFDRAVHKAVEQIISEFPLPIQNPIPIGSLYNLCKRMGINKFGGSQYRKIKEALERITTTSIKSKGTFYSKEKHEWIEDIFHLYERVVFKGRKLPNGEIADTNYLFLNSWYLDNINANYAKPINWEYYKCLENPVTQRLYELLSVKFYGLLIRRGKHISYKYSTLCDLLPITRQKYLSSAKRILDPAHKKLKETGFLRNWVWDEFIEEEGNKDWIIRYYPGEKAEEEIRGFNAEEQLELELPLLEEKKVSDDEIDSSACESSLAEELTRRGITESIARNLIETYSAEQICRQIEVFDWLRERKSPLIGKNPAGFLRKSIEGNYQPPEEYCLYLERETQRFEEERATIQKQAEKEEREEKLAKIKAYKEKLSQEERLKLRRDAETEIMNSGKYRQDFITECLIQAKENELIAKRLRMLPPK